MTWEGMQKFSFLRSVYGELTKSERRIADYIAAHAETVMEQTIADIAGQTDSSEITVSRFCKKVGCTGLQEVKLQVAAGLSTAAHDTYHDIHGDDSTYTVMWKIFKNLTEGLQDTAGLIVPAAVDRAVSILSAAGRVEVYGFGNSATVCRDIATRYMRLGLWIQAYSDAHMQVTAAALLQPGDAVIAVSHSGASAELLHSVQTAKKNGAAVIAITGHSRSPLAALADVCLCGMGREVKYSSEAGASRLIHMALGDLLYTRLAMTRSEIFQKNMKKMRREIRKKRIHSDEKD